MYQSCSLTGIRLVTIGDGILTIVTGIREDDGANGTKVLRILDLEAAEQPTVSHQGDLAFHLHAELL